jgi:hypothetical protein
VIFANSLNGCGKARRQAEENGAYRTHWDSNPSLPTFEPVSAREREFRRERVWRGQRLGGHFWQHQPILGDRDRAVPRLRRQSRGKSKTIQTASGNRNCAGLGNQVIIGTSVRQLVSPSIWC